jgi:O-succinylbenzoic acid--CoA ligase
VSTLSIFDAAREAPERIAVDDGSSLFTFAELAERVVPYCSALAAAHPPVLALTPRAHVDSLLWLYAAFALGVPVLTLHQRATEPEREAATAPLGALPPPPLSPTPLSLTPHPPSLTPSHPLVYIPTSGSTGAPRLVELSRFAVMASARASAANLGWSDDERWLACLPLAHTGGLSVVIRCLLARRAVLLFEPGEAGLLADVPRLLGVAARATLVSLVPSLLERLLDHDFRPAAALRAVLLGGSGCSPALARRAHAAGVPLLTSYGLTETSSQVVTRPYAERYQPLPQRSGCVSSGVTLPGVELELRGELIAIRAPSLLTGYVSAGSPLDSAGWLVTADRGERGAAGELYVRGRSDDVIVTGGENVDPYEVQASLCAIPGIAAAAVLGLPSPEYGAIVAALVVCDDAALASPARLAELLADRLARHKQPRIVKRVESLPLTPSGKLDRTACRAAFEQQSRFG